MSLLLAIGHLLLANVCLGVFANVCMRVYTYLYIRIYILYIGFTHMFGYADVYMSAGVTVLTPQLLCGIKLSEHSAIVIA